MEINQLLRDTFQPAFQTINTRDCSVEGAGGVVRDRVGVFFWKIEPDFSTEKKTKQTTKNQNGKRHCESCFFSYIISQNLLTMCVFL